MRCHISIIAFITLGPIASLGAQDAPRSDGRTAPNAERCSRTIPLTAPVRGCTIALCSKT